MKTFLYVFINHTCILKMTINGGNIRFQDPILGVVAEVGVLLAPEDFPPAPVCIGPICALAPGKRASSFLYDSERFGINVGANMIAGGFGAADVGLCVLSAIDAR